MMFALQNGAVEINVQAIVMAQKISVSHWRLFLLDDKVIDVTVAELDLIRPMFAPTVNLALSPMHGTLQILPGA